MITAVASMNARLARRAGEFRLLSLALRLNPNERRKAHFRTPRRIQRMFTMERLTRAIFVFTAVGVLAVSSLALAADPTQADFDACNREAQMSASGGAASPGTTGGATTGKSQDMSGSASGSVSGGTTGGAVSGSVGSGTPGGTTGGSASGGVSGGATGGSASGSASTDAQLKGMKAGVADAAYQQAYRDCMKRRGF
jgi:hypothetical protein